MPGHLSVHRSTFAGVSSRSSGFRRAPGQTEDIDFPTTGAIRRRRGLHPKTLCRCVRPLSATCDHDVIAPLRVDGPAHRPPGGASSFSSLPAFNVRLTTPPTSNNVRGKRMAGNAPGVSGVRRPLPEPLGRRRHSPRTRASAFRRGGTPHFADGDDPVTLGVATLTSVALSSASDGGWGGHRGGADELWRGVSQPLSSLG
jgi:hypothetical protein